MVNCVRLFLCQAPSGLLNDLQGAISKGQVNRMNYKNFEHITRKHGIVVEGWPLPVFDNPSSIGSQVELQVLLRAWQTGATRFRKMTAEQHMSWVESRAEPPPPLDAPPALLPPSSTHDGDEDLVTLAMNHSTSHASLNIISFEPPTTPLVGVPSTVNMPKKPRKTRSDKGKPRKKASQVLGANVLTL